MVVGYESEKSCEEKCLKKCCEDKHVDLLLIGEGDKKHYVVIFLFMYDYTLHCGRKHFCYCLQAFSIEEILKCHNKVCFKINGKKGLR